MRKWFGSVFLTEVRKLFSYRVDFWLQFLGSVTGEILIAYFLWDALFTVNKTETIGGYTFSMTMVYYVFASFVSRIVMCTDLGVVSEEIYSGSLTRYLLYPINYVYYHLARRCANICLTIFQMFLGLTIIFLFFKPSFDFNLTNYFLGLIYICLGSLFYFLVGVIIEFVAFWADNVWSLNVMYRFITQFLSGMYLPLAMYPEQARKILYLTPFPYMGAEPIKMFMGKVTFSEWLWGICMLLMWCVPALLLLKFVWSKGAKQYSGVGI